MVLQVILSLLILVAAIRLLAHFYKKRISLLFLIFFLTIWCLVLFLNWNSLLLNRFSDFLGIGRGAITLAFIGFFMLLYYVFVSLVRFYELEQEINKLARRDAIDDFMRHHDIEDRSRSD